MASSASTSTRPGAGMGRYEIVGKLATGGMAELFVARARGIEGFEKIVVLKRILPHVAQDPEFIRMFLDEARLAATLEHPNVVHVYDIGRSGEDYFFTMEYVHGVDAMQLLRAAGDEPMPLRYALAIASGVAAGLHHAHQRIGYDGKPLGIIHRDVTPTNVLISYEGAVKVADFGIAKATETKTDTSTGVRKGKTPYMSPEQCLAKDLDRRSDIFSLGVLMYELTTGSGLFHGGSEYAIMDRIVHDDVPAPSQRREDYPPALERIVMQALSRDREQRQPSAQALQLQLEELVEDERMTCSAAALGAFIEDTVGRRPYPWEDGGLTPHRTVEVTQSILRTSDLPPTRAGPKPNRRRGAAWVGAAAAAAVLGSAWVLGTADRDPATVPTTTGAPSPEPAAPPVPQRLPPDDPSPPATPDTVVADEPPAAPPVSGTGDTASSADPTPAPAAREPDATPVRPRRKRRKAAPKPTESKASSQTPDPDALFPFGRPDR